MTSLRSRRGPRNVGRADEAAAAGQHSGGPKTAAGCAARPGGEALQAAADVNMGSWDDDMHDHHGLRNRWLAASARHAGAFAPAAHAATSNCRRRRVAAGAAPCDAHHRCCTHADLGRSDRRDGEAPGQAPAALPVRWWRRPHSPCRLSSPAGRNAVVGHGRDQTLVDVDRAALELWPHQRGGHGHRWPSPPWSAPPPRMCRVPCTSPARTSSRLR